VVPLQGNRRRGMTGREKEGARERKGEREKERERERQAKRKIGRIKAWNTR